MSKLSRRPGREEIKEQRQQRKKAQRELRRRQKAEGFILPPCPSQPNKTSPYQDVEEERAARTDLVGEQVKVFRAMLPVLLKRLNKISDPRNPKKNKHKLTVLLIYGILCFAFQMSSRREANREMTRPMFLAVAMLPLDKKEVRGKHLEFRSDRLNLVLFEMSTPKLYRTR